MKTTKTKIGYINDNDLHKTMGEVIDNFMEDDIVYKVQIIGKYKVTVDTILKEVK